MSDPAWGDPESISNPGPNPYHVGDPVAYRVADYADGWILYQADTWSEETASRYEGHAKEALYSDKQLDRLQRQLTHKYQMANTRWYVSYENMKGACESWRIAAWIWFSMLVILMIVNLIGALI